MLWLSGRGTMSPGWSSYGLSGGALLNLPERDMSFSLPLLPGIVSLDDGLHIRGSRSYATQYLLEGTNVTNPLYGLPAVNLIPQAVASVTVHTGPFGARLPSATGGAVESAMRTGGDEFEMRAEFRTDDFAKPGNPFLGTTPQGLKDFVLSMGGAVTPGLTYFLAGEYVFLRNDQSLFLEPFRFDGLQEDGLYGGVANQGRLLVAPDPAEAGRVEYKRNYIFKNWTRRSALNATITADLFALVDIPMMVKLSGVFGRSRFPGGGPFPGSGGGWPGSLGGYFRAEDREMMNETRTTWVSGNASLRLGPGAVVDFTVSYQRHSTELFDPDFGRSGFDDYLEYADSLAHARRGLRTDEWQNRYKGPDVQSTIYAFPFLHPNTPNNMYARDEQQALSVQGRLSAVVSSRWQLEIGGSVDSWIMRRYELGNIGLLLTSLDPNLDGDFSDSPQFASEYERRVWYIQHGQINAYGYSYLGEETNGYTLHGSDAELDPPYKPTFAAAYAELDYKNEAIDAALGLRYEYFAPRFKDWIPRGLTNSTTGDGPWYRDIPFDGGLSIGDEALIDESDVFSFVLPRAHLRVPLGKKGAIFVAFGSYASMPALDRLYLSSPQFTSASGDGPYTLSGKGVAFEVRPERSTHYELGARLLVSSRLVVSGSFYYKNLWNQLQIGQYLGIQGEPVFPSYQSTGYGSARGIELGLDILRKGGLAISVAYAYSSAAGLTSDPLTTLPIVTDYPPSGVSYEHPRPYAYEKQHTATGILDYRAGADAGSVLRNMSLTGVCTFQSGHPYTQEYPPRAGWGLATPWTIGVKSFIDPRTYAPQEPRNSSRTPSAINLDLKLSKTINIGALNVEAFFAVLNVFNTTHVLNLYPTTGSASTDGWLGSDRVPPYLNVPIYDEFYQAINPDNRWAYAQATGKDLYGSPRQFRLGLIVQFGDR